MRVPADHLPLAAERDLSRLAAGYFAPLTWFKSAVSAIWPSARRVERLAKGPRAVEGDSTERSILAVASPDLLSDLVMDPGWDLAHRSCASTVSASCTWSMWSGVCASNLLTYSLSL